MVAAKLVNASFNLSILSLLSLAFFNDSSKDFWALSKALATALIRFFSAFNLLSTSVILLDKSSSNLITLLVSIW